MKKIIIMALLGLASFGAKAQSWTVRNNERCDITVTPSCVDNSKKCAVVATGAPVIVHCCGGIATVASTCPVGPNFEPLFTICWHSSLCTPTCVTVDGANNPLCGFPTATLPACSDCIQPPSTGLVTITPGGGTINVN